MTDPLTRELAEALESAVWLWVSANAVRHGDEWRYRMEENFKGLTGEKLLTALAKARMRFPDLPITAAYAALVEARTGDLTSEPPAPSPAPAQP